MSSIHCNVTQQSVWSVTPYVDAMLEFKITTYRLMKNMAMVPKLMK
jgi:hypothetical protein